MRNTIVFLAIMAVAASQGIERLPSCSLDCFIQHVPKVGCGLYDFACSCAKADELTPLLTPCVLSSCSPEDQAKVLTALDDICAAAGAPMTTVTAVPEVTSTAIHEPIPTVVPEPTSSEYDEPFPTEEPEVPELPELTSAGPPLIITTLYSSSVYALPSEVYEEPPEETTPIIIATETPVETTLVPQVSTNIPLPGSTTPPYPSSAAWFTSGTPSGTGSLVPSPPAFTDAATFARPGGLAGVLGLLAFVL